MDGFRTKGEPKISRIKANKAAELKGVMRHPERDNAFIADVYQRLDRAMGGGVVMFSGAAIHLIWADRKVSDIDVFVQERKLFINEMLQKRLEKEGFTISVLKGNKIYAVVDNKSGIKVETANSSLKVDNKILTDHRDICRILGCKEDTDTLVGFSADTIMRGSIYLPITNSSGEVVNLRLPDPVHQIGLKYNLLRLRGGTKDIEDMRKIMGYYFGNFDSFVQSGGVEKLRSVGEFLGQDFENRILEILRG